MLCNMRSKLIPTDHIYIPISIEFFLSFDVSEPPHLLVDCMSYTIMLKQRDFEWYAKKKTLFEH